MKKGIILSVIAIILLLGLLVFSIQYRNNINANNPELEYSATTAKPDKAETETKKKLQGVIVENKEGGYQLIVDGEAMYLVHGEYKIDLTSWKNAVERELPTLHYFDFDGDGKKELIMRRYDTALKDLNNSSVQIPVYIMAVFYEHINDSTGEKTFTYFLANDSSWKGPFENAITCEMTQLDGREKYLQFAMSNKGERVEYDENSIAKSKDAYYFSAPKNDKGEYGKIKAWAKNYGVYTIDKNGKIYLDIHVAIEYENYPLIDDAGTIRCQMVLKNGMFDIKAKSIKFIPNKDRKISNPRKKPVEEWKLDIVNTGQAPEKNGKVLNWINGTFDVAGQSSTQRMSFAEMESNIKYVDSIVFARDKIILTAQSGYSFSESLVNVQAFKVIANAGTKDELNIGFNCELDDSAGKSTLILNLDNTYSQQELKTVSISFER